MNRREFLIGTAAATAIVSLPPGLVPAAPTPPPPRVGYWGYSRPSSGFYFGWDEGIATREEAIRHATNYYGDGKVEIAWCVPRRLHYPDLREELCDWLCDDSRRYDLAESLLLSIEGANEDSDYEGELADAFCGAEDHGFAAAVDRALVSALARLDRLDLYTSDSALGLSPFTGDLDPVLNLLQRDAVFGIDLNCAARAWGKVNELDDAPRVIDLEDEEVIVIAPQPKASEHQS